MSPDSSTTYDAADMMIISAARQIQDEEAVYVGVGLPMVAVLLAKSTHAPNCTIVIENGIIRKGEFQLPAGTDTVGTQFRADQLANLNYISYLGQSGFINLGFLGAGQIDRFGNVNDTVIGDYRDPIYRFPGSGGGNDVMSFCHRTCIIVRQSKRRFPEKVDFITCPGFLDGKEGQREGLGIPKGTGPAAVITDLGCYGFENGEMILKTIHAGCGVTLDKIKAEVGWQIKVSPNLGETQPPTTGEIQALRQKVDPNRRWSGGKHSQPTPD
jgi:glutaconate CoA-transferase, subunit B